MTMESIYQKLKLIILMLFCEENETILLHFATPQKKPLLPLTASLANKQIPISLKITLNSYI